MKLINRHALFLAVLALPASVSLAQYRIDNGFARDANNRVGSGGFNTDRSQQFNGRINGLAGNYIVTGNVTQGKSFRGSIGYTDPSAFRGSLGSASFDNFMRDSVGVAQMRGTANPSGNYATLQPYFGAGATVKAPDGMARDPSTGAFYLQPARVTTTAGDGRIDFGGASRPELAQGAISAQRVTGGAGLTTSPFASLSQREQLSNLTQVSDFTQLARPTRTNIQRVGEANDELKSGPRVPELELPGESGSIGLEKPDQTKQSLPESIGATGQGSVYRNLRAMDNNTQYAELRKRLEIQKSLPKLPGSEAVESLNQMNADILEARAKAKEEQGGAAPGDAAPRVIPDRGEKQEARPESISPTLPGPTPNLVDDNLNLPRPTETEAKTLPGLSLEITSLASGVKDKDLGKVLAEAEAAMKAGKFSTAIEAYDRAEELASDDPLVFMGRSIAELGGGYYRSAEIHLRQAYQADRALLLAKFDLRSMLTDERLNSLQNDLAQIARKNDKDSGPLLLLAFIYYNSGFPERSERALEMVQERAGGNDPSAKILKDSWFPAAEAPAQSK